MREIQLLSLFSEEMLFVGIWFAGLLASGLLLSLSLWGVKALGDLCIAWERRKLDKALNKALP